MPQREYAGNLSYNTDEDGLRTLFAEFGEVESVNLIADRETGRPRGCAFVEMATEQAARASMDARDGKSHDDREIKVDTTRPQADRDRRLGGKRRLRW